MVVYGCVSPHYFTNGCGICKKAYILILQILLKQNYTKNELYVQHGLEYDLRLKSWTMQNRFFPNNNNSNNNSAHRIDWSYGKAINFYMYMFWPIGPIPIIGLKTICLIRFVRKCLFGWFKGIWFDPIYWNNKQTVQHSKWTYNRIIVVGGRIHRFFPASPNIIVIFFLSIIIFIWWNICLNI